MHHRVPLVSLNQSAAFTIHIHQHNKTKQEITAEEERHARQAAAMAAFRAAERDETAAQFGKEHADAAVDRMKGRLEKLKAVQVGSLQWEEFLYHHNGLRGMEGSRRRKVGHPWHDDLPVLVHDLAGGAERQGS